MISQDVIKRIVTQEKALQEINALLKAIAQEVEELDGDVLLAPAEIEEECNASPGIGIFPSSN
ncbi:hypothetical protein [Desulfovulcanus sp.]